MRDCCSSGMTADGRRHPVRSRFGRRPARRRRSGVPDRGRAALGRRRPAVGPAHAGSAAASDRPDSGAVGPLPVGGDPTGDLAPVTCPGQSSAANLRSRSFSDGPRSASRQADQRPAPKQVDAESDFSEGKRRTSSSGAPTLRGAAQRPGGPAARRAGEVGRRLSAYRCPRPLHRPLPGALVPCSRPACPRSPG